MFRRWVQGQHGECEVVKEPRSVLKTARTRGILTWPRDGKYRQDFPASKIESAVTAASDIRNTARIFASDSSDLHAPNPQGSGSMGLEKIFTFIS